MHDPEQRPIEGYRPIQTVLTTSKGRANERAEMTPGTAGVSPKLSSQSTKPATASSCRRPCLHSSGGLVSELRMREKSRDGSVLICPDLIQVSWQLRPIEIVESGLVRVAEVDRTCGGPGL